MHCLLVLKQQHLLFTLVYHLTITRSRAPLKVEEKSEIHFTTHASGDHDDMGAAQLQSNCAAVAADAIAATGNTPMYALWMAAPAPAAAAARVAAAVPALHHSQQQQQQHQRQTHQFAC